MSFVYELTGDVVELDSFDLAETAVFDEVFRQHRRYLSVEVGL